MKFRDQLYGEFCLQPGAALEAVRSPALERLRGVHQSGAAYLVRHRRDVTRYDHSVGVMALLQRLGRGPLEQLAGLIHDVGHTAFSHVIDSALGFAEEDFHENWTERVARATGLWNLLEDHEVDPHAVCDSAGWPTLDAPCPDLCADRIDYTLRDLVTFGSINRREVKPFLDQLIVLEDGKVACTSLQAAVWFVDAYCREITELFMDPREAYANARLGEAIRLALVSGEMPMAMLLATDADLLRMLATAREPEIRVVLRELSFDLAVVEDFADCSVQVFTKDRVVDPLVVTTAGEVRASELDAGAGERIAELRRHTARGLWVRPVRPGERSRSAAGAG